MYRAMLLGAMLSGVAVVPVVMAGSHGDHFHAVLSGFNEIGALNANTGAILSEGHGTLDLQINRATQTITFTETFSGLGSPVTQSHIHFGKTHVAGGVMVFFCSNLASAPAGTQPCPAGGGTVTGTLTAANVLAIAGQNVPAGDFDALTDALESNTAYVNVHTTGFPAGEIRGQIHRGDGDGDHDD
ncbi:MAG: CHRD domain-containing protein [Sinobacteraceae bacterium]|nr:CHRD domain-containing protein [Nevskiaceae bacterium]